MSDSRVQRALQEKNRKKKSKHRFWKWLLSILLLVILGFSGIFLYFGMSAPHISSEVLQSGGSSSIYDQKGHEITTLGNQNRTYVTIDKVPKQMRNAVVSTEDRHFYKEHFGVNPLRILMAAVNNLRGGDLQGGSTLTQQLIKLSVFSTKKSDQTMKRKMQEVWLAAKVERDFSKDQILEFYMNKVYMANGVYGFQTAAHYYFGKNLKQLDLSQMALLAGMPQAPNTYNPYANPTAAKSRRDLVIKAMLNNHKISQIQAQQAIATPINDGLKPYKPNSGVGENKIIVDPYIKEVIQDVKKKGYDPYRDNLKITVNMDLDAQKYLYNLVNNNNSVVFPNNKLQTGVSVVDPNNGAVVAMIGGRQLDNVQLGLNRAVQNTRSNGSTMKPILDYAPAIEYLKWNTNHTLEDSPYTYPGTDLTLQNWDHTYQGAISMRSALAQSRNIPAVKTLQTVGFNRARKFAQKLDINVPQKQGLSAGIGSDVSSLQMAAAYSSFANGGTYYKPQYVSKIQTTDGLVHNYDTKSHRVMKTSTAYMITDILKDVVKPNGMGSQAYISGLHQAGKTGTTNYSNAELAKNPGLAGTAKDALFAGFTKHYSIGIWTGYDNPTEAGINAKQQEIAGQIYQHMMRYLATNKSNPDWKRPHSVVQAPGTNILYVRGTQPANLPKNNTIQRGTTTNRDNAEINTNRNHSNTNDRDNETSDNTTTTDGNNAPSQQPNNNNNQQATNQPADNNNSGNINQQPVNPPANNNGNNSSSNPNQANGN
ncbi:transglycosylase domain-containing protein [Bombilactobacillus thymidiniphilus]|uniref:PBP1A family penicillin-binding protein n=1 Tax=Bombilactobacillus thymidiniphilus TaxID=2923363 RepID=A0ABY4PCS9_9LACO|nr:PBP1A family penicillin-binding protein [Bombilactobacillus thymidiniphilus]UQS83568.1 PBP1A family penicillin-binding protein [Bombilactobacillus thymidiniphilus]